MIPFINPSSLIPFSESPAPPTPVEAIGLTADSLFSWLLYSLGWHEAALPRPVLKILRKRFESVPFELRRQLIRSDLIPHRVLPPDSFRIDDPIILSVYRLTAAIRQLAVRSAHRMYKDPSRNPVACYADEHRLWLPEAELNWLRMREGMCAAVEGKYLDFPISMRFTLCQPQQPTQEVPRKTGQMRTMTLDSRANFDLRANRNSGMSNDSDDPDDPTFDGYWPIQFHSSTHSLEHNMGSNISFSRSRNGLGIDLPETLQRIGRSWIENSTWGPNNRVLFQKECSDKEVGILLWPSFPEHRYRTPRIPVYLDDIIELVEGDRLLIFLGSRRGFEDAVLQIDITCNWISGRDRGRIYADKKYVYPNPCERYPHCLRRPINRPAISMDPLPLQEFVRPQSEYSSTQVIEEKPRSSRKGRKSFARTTRSESPVDSAAEPQSTYDSMPSRCKRSRSPEPGPSGQVTQLESISGSLPSKRQCTRSPQPGPSDQVDQLPSTFESMTSKRQSQSFESPPSGPSKRPRRESKTQSARV